VRVRTRLVVFGAALPALALLAAVVVAGVVFRLSLLRALDRALLAQAAVESVSLFDGPEGAPHLHIGKSPLANDVRSFVPTAGLYRATGALAARFPENGRIPDPPLEGEGESGPRLVTRTARDGGVVRALAVAVRAPWGEPYVLKLEGSLGEVDATMGLYWRATLGLVAVATALLFSLQWAQAGRMSRRIADMTGYLPRLRGGELGFRLPADATGDEIADLRVALTEAMERLGAARDAQERLIANAAHELRTPLGLMRTEMDLALRKERSAAELRAALAEAREEVTRLSNLAARLLDLAALGQVTWQKSDADLTLIVREAVDACEAEVAARGLRVALALPVEASAEVDAQTIRQAVDNYLSNAVAHAPPGTAIHVGLEAEGEGYRLTVRDEGEGVPAEEAARIFEPFSRGSRPKEAGAGLGLSIVREVARRHGGRAHLAKPGGEGATFILWIPRRG
jgi:signal transduction histidine kinase